MKVLEEFRHCIARSHRWELPGNYPIFAVLLYLENWMILVTPNFCIKYSIIKIYYPVEPVHIHIISLINIISEKN